MPVAEKGHCLSRRRAIVGGGHVGAFVVDVNFGGEPAMTSAALADAAYAARLRGLVDDRTPELVRRRAAAKAPQRARRLPFHRPQRGVRHHPCAATRPHRGHAPPSESAQP